MNTIIIFIVIVCVLLVLVVLAQNSKGGGLSSQFGGSSTSQIMGVKKTGDFLEKATWTLAIALLVLTLSTTFFIPKNTGTQSSSPNIDRAEDRAVLPSLDGVGDLDNATQGDGNATEGTTNSDTTGNN
ncbi:preprotein translocase subunit SecG [Fulvivirgaceae bacterium BMA10]|uniref:Protein-export membrane protein SecG n=1 Tax=Splendidivirga corallicola TaxID=3051826 RepID=A0ABT8KX16_9BACT|nr:preprotein translocase subunit SecG [Fulvivirgaceae bacterium BMA10]